VELINYIYILLSQGFYSEQSVCFEPRYHAAECKHRYSFKQQFLCKRFYLIISFGSDMRLLVIVTQHLISRYTFFRDGIL